MMDENLKLELKYYNQIEIWGNYIINQQETNKTRVTLKFIPTSVKSVLDIGYGNGTLTNLINRQLLVGLDFAKIPLNSVKGNVIQASVDALPIESKKLDQLRLFGDKMKVKDIDWPRCTGKGGLRMSCTCGRSAMRLWLRNPPQNNDYKERVGI